MIHLSEQIENYVIEYKTYLEGMEKEMERLCERFMSDVKYFKKYVKEFESNEIDEWFVIAEAMEESLPKAQNISEYVSEMIFYDSFECPAQRHSEWADCDDDDVYDERWCDQIVDHEEEAKTRRAKEAILDKWRSDYKRHMTCLMEARYIEVKQECQGFLKRMLMKYGTKATIGALGKNDEIYYIKPSEEDVDKLIEALDCNLKDKKYGDVLKMYEEDSAKWVDSPDFLHQPAEKTPSKPSDYDPELPF